MSRGKAKIAQIKQKQAEKYYEIYFEISEFSVTERNKQWQIYKVTLTIH